MHNVRKLHIFGHEIITCMFLDWSPDLICFFFALCFFLICQCVFEKNIARQRTTSEDRTKSSVYGGHGHKTPVSGSLLQSATIIFFSALSLQKDNPTLALCTLTYVWVLIKLCLHCTYNGRFMTCTKFNVMHYLRIEVLIDCASILSYVAGITCQAS